MRDKTSLKENYHQEKQSSVYAKISLKDFTFRQASFHSASSALYLYHMC